MVFKKLVLRKAFSRKKSFRRKRKMRSTAIPQGMTLIGFPRIMKMKHRYSEVISSSATSGAINNQNFACNGMFDPNIGGAGHQPLAFNQMEVLYDHYTVIGSVIKIKVIAQAATDEPIIMGLYKDDDSSILTNINSLLEQGQGATRFLGPATDRVTTLTSKWSAKKTFGGSIMGQENLKGTGASNPVDLTHYMFWFRSANAAATVQITLQVTIDYIAVWTEKKSLAFST